MPYKKIGVPKNIVHDYEQSYRKLQDININLFSIIDMLEHEIATYKPYLEI